MRVGILSQRNSPLARLAMDALLSNSDYRLAFLVDQEPISQRNLDLWNRRTGNHFKEQQERRRLVDQAGSDLSRIQEFDVPSHNSIEVMDAIKRLDLDILVNAGTPRVLKPPILTATPWGVLNVHPGLLPQFRGCSCVEWALWTGSAIGVSAHQMSEGIDAGPVFEERSIEFTGREKYKEIRVRVYVESISLMKKVLSGISSGQIKHGDLRVQDEALAQYWPPMPADLESKIMENPWGCSR